MAGEMVTTARGFLGGDVEVKLVRDREVAEFSVAVSIRRKKDDTWEDVRTDWAQVSVWGNQIGAVAQLTKGTLVEVTGRLVPGAYISKAGEALPSTQIIADKVTIVPRAPKSVAAAEQLADAAPAGTPF